MLAEAIVDFLSFSGKAGDHLTELSGFRNREWEGTLTWLHGAGLALYLLQKLKDSNATDILPTSVLSRLDENLAANRRRVTSMSRQLNLLNQRFDAAGVKYVVVKGFSLVPQFCPDASLRHQSDFDYLIDAQSLPVAQHALEEVGYFLKKHSASEFVFLMPSARMPISADEQYEAHAPHAVELHLSFWDVDLHGVFLDGAEFSVENIKARPWQGMVLRSLPDEDAFLLQAIHVFHHIFTGSVRMSWLYEIGFFLTQPAPDTLLWERIESRVENNPLLSEMLAVVTELSVQFFGARVPSTFRGRLADIRPVVRVWIQNYARTWAFKTQVGQGSLFSVDKMVLFLHLQYLSEARTRRHLIRMRLLPLEKLFQRARSITSLSSTNSGDRTRQLGRVFIRFLSHVTRALRFFWEIPHWLRLQRAIRPALPTGMLRHQNSFPTFRVQRRPNSCDQDSAVSEKPL